MRFIPFVITALATMIIPRLFCIRPDYELLLALSVVLSSLWAFWPCHYISRHVFILGYSLTILGSLLNYLVFCFNDGKFPVSQYTPKEYWELSLAPYYFMADSETPLAWLGDYKILFGGSVGDIGILVGILLIHIFFIRAAWREHNTHENQ